MNLRVGLYVLVDSALCFCRGSWMDCKSTLTQWLMGHVVAEVTNKDRDHEALTEPPHRSLHRVKGLPSRFSADSVRNSVCFKSGDLYHFSSLAEKKMTEQQTSASCVYALNIKRTWQVSQGLMIFSSYTFSTKSHGREQRREDGGQHVCFSPIQYHTQSFQYLITLLNISFWDPSHIYHCTYWRIQKL